MFKRPRHQLVSKVLRALAPEFLRDNRCYFGGGTRIVMELDEYRESLDIDLLCADIVGYRNIRSQISEQSLGAILTTPLSLAREVRADRFAHLLRLMNRVEYNICMLNRYLGFKECDF